MPGIYVSLLPEEPLYSSVARFAEWMRFPTRAALMTSLFGSKKVAGPAAQLPSHLAALQARMPPGTCSVRTLLEDHTAFPFYRAFLTHERALDVEGAMIRGEVQDGLLTCKFAYEPDGVCSVLRFCPRCVEEDRASAGGVAYWRRVHQLPCVVVCPNHGCALCWSEKTADVPWRSRVHTSQWPYDKDQPISLELVLAGPTATCPVPDSALEPLGSLARDALWLLTHHVETHSLGHLAARHRAWLAERGLVDVAGRIRTNAFVAAFLEATPPEMLEPLGCSDWSRTSHRPRAQWCTDLWQEPARRHPPLLHLLLLRFCGISAETFFTEPPPTRARISTRKLPSPCTNPTCTARAPTDLDPAWADAVLGVTHLEVDCPECGFAYRLRARGKRRTILRMGPRWEDRLRALAADGRTSLRRTASVLGVSVARVRQHARVLDVWSRAWGARPCGLPSNSRAQARVTMIADHRRVLSRILFFAFGDSESAIRQAAPNTWRYLRAHDREWFDQQRRHMLRGPRYLDLRTVGNPERWHQLIHTAIAVVLTWPGKPQRITSQLVSELLAPVSLKVSRFSRLANLGKVSGLRETARAFAERRIVWAAKWFATEGELPSLDQLARRSGLSDGQQRLHRRALGDALDALRTHLRDGAAVPETWISRFPAECGDLGFHPWWPGGVEHASDFRYYFGGMDDVLATEAEMTARGRDARIEVRRRKGFGEGVGASYRPWLTVRSFGSRGMAHRVYSHTCRRLHHLFSTHELGCFWLMEWSPSIIDIREQFPLHPLEETQEIARTLGVAHPRRRVRRRGLWVEEDDVMTTDFRLTLAHDATGLGMAVSVKPGAELSDRRTLEKQQIERVYWQRRRIPWRIVTERELPPALIDNLQLVLPCRDLRDFDLPLEQVPALVDFLYDQISAAPSVPLGKRCTAADEQLGLPRGGSLTLVWHAIGTRAWSVDLDERLDASRPLVGLSRGAPQATTRRISA